MIATPSQPHKRDGVGAVHDHTGKPVGLFRHHQRRREVAELLPALVDQQPTGTIAVAWDNASTHLDDDIEALVRATAGRLVRLSRHRLVAVGSRLLCTLQPLPATDTLHHRGTCHITFAVVRTGGNSGTSSSHSSSGTSDFVMYPGYTQMRFC